MAPSSVPAGGMPLVSESDTQSQQILDSWVARYQRTGRPVAVNFSTLTSDYYIKDKATHLIHFYPAKLLRQIPEFFISALTKPGDSVLDPFAGSGTVLLEALSMGRRAYGAEINPLARLVTQAKTTPIQSSHLAAATEHLLSSIDLRSHSVGDLPEILRFWHTPKVLKQLSALANCVRAWEPDCDPRYATALKNFFLVAFSSIIRKKSLADPRVAPPVRLNPRKFPPNSKRHAHMRKMLAAKRRADCRHVFESAIKEATRRVLALGKMLPLDSWHPCTFVASDAKDIPNNGSFSADLIVTSPPYIAAQKYTRSTSLELYWLGFLQTQSDRAALEHRVIGSEIPLLERGQSRPEPELPAVDRIVKRLWGVNRSRAKIVANYFADMKTVLDRLARVLNPGGHLVLVVGNNTVCGKSIPVARILRDVCTSQLGLACRTNLVDKIRAYGLMTKRNHTAGIITREHILVMQKPTNHRSTVDV